MHQVFQLAQSLDPFSKSIIKLKTINSHFIVYFIFLAAFICMFFQEHFEKKNSFIIISKVPITFWNGKGTDHSLMCYFSLIWHCSTFVKHVYIDALIKILIKG